jgi:hypothetical protein
VGLERGSLSLENTSEEELGRKGSGSSLENREYGRRDLSRWPRETFYPQKLALTLPTGVSRSVSIVRCGISPRTLYFLFEHSWEGQNMASLKRSPRSCKVPGRYLVKCVYKAKIFNL